MVVERELYAFKAGRPAKVLKIANFTDTKDLVIIDLNSTVGSSDKFNYVTSFSVCLAAGKIVLTGGQGEAAQHYAYQTKTYVMDL